MKTFADAIEIAWRLGAHYMWIDSLCIIQDSRQDWLQESGQMSDVYRYSAFNISATSAVDDTVGCFFDPDSNIAVPIRLHFDKRAIGCRSTSDGRAVEVVEYPWLNGYFELDMYLPNAWARDVTRSVINRRAWVLQEVSHIPDCSVHSSIDSRWERTHTIKLMSISLNF